MNGRQAVRREAAPRFLETTVALEKKFLKGRQNRAEELESAVRLFHITDSPQEAVALIQGVAHPDAGEFG